MSRTFLIGDVLAALSRSGERALGDLLLSSDPPPAYKGLRRVRPYTEFSASSEKERRVLAVQREIARTYDELKRSNGDGVALKARLKNLTEDLADFEAELAVFRTKHGKALPVRGQRHPRKHYQ